MDYHITPKLGQVSHLMLQVGLYNARQMPLKQLKTWMEQHKIEFNLGSAHDGDVLQLAAVAGNRNGISFCVSVTPYLMIGGRQ